MKGNPDGPRADSGARLRVRRVGAAGPDRGVADRPDRSADLWAPITTSFWFRHLTAGRAWCEAHPDELGNGYNFAKQAIIVWTMMQGVELGTRAIRINCIGPTVTDTPFLADTIKTYGEGFIDAFPKPLGRVSKPEEQARALIFLNGDAASYITGQVLWTDGGYLGGVTTGLITT